jgi:hypothetical protein
MNSKQILLMSKLGKKNVGTIDKVAPQDVASTEEVPAGMKLPTMNQVGSKDILKSTKAADMSKLPSSDVVGGSAVPSTEQVDAGIFKKTKKVPYSPIKNYLKGSK